MLWFGAITSSLSLGSLGRDFGSAMYCCVTLGYSVNFYEPQFLHSKIRITVTVSQRCYEDT